MKVVTIQVAEHPKYPELAINYLHLWAGFFHGITVPETFIRIFGVLHRSTDTEYFRRMAMGYVIYWRIAAATNHYLDRDALNALLVNLAVL